MKIIGVIGIDVYTDDGQKFDARDFINAPKAGDSIEQYDDRLFSVHVGDSSECVGGACGLDKI